MPDLRQLKPISDVSALQNKRTQFGRTSVRVSGRGCLYQKLRQGRKSLRHHYEVATGATRCSYPASLKDNFYGGHLPDLNNSNEQPTQVTYIQAFPPDILSFALCSSYSMSVHRQDSMDLEGRLRAFLEWP